MRGEGGGGIKVKREHEERKEYLAGLCVGRRDTVRGYHSEGEERESFTI